ncbi:hypothetical protein OG741_13785 [Streptomyces sp. NBC_01410]|uniref:hypothetical protein n=1 Tax=Streptomyces sp. NBC_01410 TaxID=2903856 RepID=UPI0032553CA4
MFAVLGVFFAGSALLALFGLCAVALHDVPRFTGTVAQPDMPFLGGGGGWSGAGPPWSGCCGPGYWWLIACPLVWS